MAEVICDDRATREINAEIKRRIAQGETELLIKTPNARHNLGVAILQPAHITFDGSVGYYCAGMIDGPTVEIKGSAGWGLAESMMDGSVVIHGDAAARLGVSMKGGLILVGGDCGYMAGFMGQKGTLIVCGNAGEAFADSMYEAVCFVGGKIVELGNDAVIEKPTTDELTFLESTLSRYLPQKIDAIQNFKKIISGRKLWNFDKKERAVWREAL